MSLTRHKIAFDLAADGLLSDDLRRDLFLRFATALVKEAGGQSLAIPTSLRDHEAERAQGDLFDKHRESGLSIRSIARAEGVSKDRVFRHLSQRRNCSATAA